MAEGTITEVEENLKCGVCLETYCDPKQLQCHHIFCLKCIRGLMAPFRNSLTCPTCRVVARLPAGGVDDVPSAFQITPFLEIVTKHRSERGAAASASVDSCSVHPDKELEFYCETCGVLICYKCALKGGSHHNHDYKEIAEAFEVCKKDISSTMAPMEKQLTTINKAVAEFDKLRSAITSTQTSTKTGINNDVALLYRKIDARKEELTTQVDQITEQKLQKLHTQMQPVKAMQSKYNDFIDSMKESLKSTNHRDVLRRKKATIMEADQVASSFQSTDLKPTVISTLEPTFESTLKLTLESVLESTAAALECKSDIAATEICTPHGQNVGGNPFQVAVPRPMYTPRGGVSRRSRHWQSSHYPRPHMPDPALELPDQGGYSQWEEY